MDEHKGRLRASELEDSGDVGVNPTQNLTMGEIIATRFDHRIFGARGVSNRRLVVPVTSSSIEEWELVHGPAAMGKVPPPEVLPFA